MIFEYIHTVIMHAYGIIHFSIVALQFIAMSVTCERIHITVLWCFVLIMISEKALPFIAMFIMHL